MKNHNVYFEIYGKKMKVVKLAESAEAAKEAVRNDITFHKVELKPNDAFNEADRICNDMMDMLKNPNK